MRKNIGNTFFVDYENVSKSGLAGLSLLTINDIVYIFYSVACPKLSLETLHNNQAQISTVEVAAGKQGLDIQLSSYLGHMIQDGPGKYYIVSKDADFDKIIQFWNNRGYSNLYRIQCLGASESVKESEFSDSDSNETEENCPSMEDPDVKNWVSNVICQYAECDDVKSRVHGALTSRFGQKAGRLLYLQVKQQLA